MATIFAEVLDVRRGVLQLEAIERGRNVGTLHARRRFGKLRVSGIFARDAEIADQLRSTAKKIACGEYGLPLEYGNRGGPLTVAPCASTTFSRLW